MDTAKARFLFGVEDPGFDPDDEDALANFIAAELAGEEDDPGEDGSARDLQVLLTVAVASQVRDDEPPETWGNAQRLLAVGLDRRAILDQMALVASYLLELALSGDDDDGGDDHGGDDHGDHGHGGHDHGDDGGDHDHDHDGHGHAGFDRGRYVELLDQLPLPDADELARSAVARVAASQGMALDDLRGELLAEAGAAVGGAPELAEIAVDAALEEFGGLYGELAVLVRDRVVHLPSLTSGMVLTHRLTDDEQVGDALDCVGSDLAGFAWWDELGDGADGEVVSYGDQHGDVSWMGPEGWLGPFSGGDLVAVRVSDGGEVAIERIEDMATPGPSAPLVAALRAAYDDAAEVTGLPVPITVLVAEVLLARPGAFTEPTVPLVELCAAAGLEVDGGYVAHDPALWRSRSRQERSHRVHVAFDWDHGRAHEALAVLDLVEEPGAPPAELRRSLATLGDQEVAEVVLGELAGPLGPAQDEVAAAQAWAERLVGAARRPKEAMAAHWVAGVLAERRDDALAAERHFKAALEADSGWGVLVDRVAWYASDRGEAAHAAGLWRLLESPDGLELGAVLAAAANGAGVAKPGRNEPCWCGSGRKAKACHRGVTPRAALEDRAAWLYQKARSYALRHEAAADDLAVLAGEAAQAGADAAAGLGPATIAVVADLTLAELGWFDRFVEGRGPLLPEDELALAGSWTGVGRLLYEVVSVAGGQPSGPASLRQRCSGEVVEVIATTGVPPTPGELVCGRVLPVGASHLLVGAFAVPGAAAGEAEALCASADVLGLCRLAVGGEPGPGATGVA